MEILEESDAETSSEPDDSVSALSLKKKTSGRQNVGCCGLFPTIPCSVLGVVFKYFVQGLVLETKPNRSFLKTTPIGRTMECWSDAPNFETSSKI